MSIEQEALAFIHSLQQMYLERQNVETVLQAIAEETSWIGTGEREIEQGVDDARQALLSEQAECGGFTVTDSSYRTLALPCDACVVYGEFSAQPSDGASTVAKLRYRVTAVCARTDEGMKLLHLHLSSPDRDLEQGERYVKKRTQEDNRALRRLIEQREKDLWDRSRELEALIGNIPGGVRRCADDDVFTILSLSGGFFSLFGYTREEISSRFHDRFLDMIHPADRAIVLESRRRQLTESPTVEFEYRATRKDGETRWILDRGQLVTMPDGQRTFFCVLLDITRRKKDQEQLRLSLERHQVIMDQATDIIFEWDIVQDTLTYSANWRKKFGYDPIHDEISARLPQSGHIASEDLREFVKIKQDIAAGVAYAEAEFRICNQAGQYTWCRIRATAQFDREHHPIKAIGVIVDIQEEKRQKQILLDQAQQDALTGLYNKNATKQRIEQILAQGNPTASHALMILDVDDFKGINDRFGHPCGDTVLSTLSDGLKRLFRATDVIGRIGGDEFLVFMSNLSTQEDAAAKAREILKVLRGLAAELDASLSCSVGLALYPRDAKTYPGLCQCADSALYEVKNSGKVGYAFFEDAPGDGIGYTVSRAAYPDPSVTQTDRKLVRYSFQRLYRSEDIKTEIGRIMEVIGQRYDISHVYIREYSAVDGSCAITFEWRGEGDFPEQEHAQVSLCAEEWEAYAKNFDERGVFYCRNVQRDAPLSAGLTERGVLSLLQCAIRGDGGLAGFIGFDECRPHRYWTAAQISSLTRISNVVATFLHNLRLQEEVARLRRGNAAAR